MKKIKNSLIILAFILFVIYALVLKLFGGHEKQKECTPTVHPCYAAKHLPNCSAVRGGLYPVK